MAKDEEARRELYERLDEVLGHRQATTLMEHLPPAGWSHLATKDDVRVLEHKMDAVRHELRGEIYRTARNQTLALVAVMGAMNGGLFAALKFA